MEFAEAFQYIELSSMSASKLCVNTVWSIQRYNMIQHEVSFNIDNWLKQLILIKYYAYLFTYLFL